MDWIKIFELLVTVLTIVAFGINIYRYTKYKNIEDGIWAILFWVALMTIV